MCVGVCVLLRFANGQAYNFALMGSVDEERIIKGEKTSNDDESRLPRRSIVGSIRGGAMNVCVCVCGARLARSRCFDSSAQLLSPQHLPTATLPKSVEPPFFGVRPGKSRHRVGAAAGAFTV